MAQALLCPEPFYPFFRVRHFYGDGPLAGPLMEEIGNPSELGVRIVGFVGQ